MPYWDHVDTLDMYYHAMPVLSAALPATAGGDSKTDAAAATAGSGEVSRAALAAYWSEIWTVPLDPHKPLWQFQVSGEGKN
jgi:hypothetical protein